MSIQKMKRVRLIGLRSEKDAFLDDLLRFGKVEISDYPQAEGDVVVFSTNNYDKTGLPADMLVVNQNKLSAALDIMQRYFPEKKGLLDPKPEAPLESFLSDARLNSCLHSATRVIRLDGAAVEEATLTTVSVFFLLYLLLLAAVSLVVALDGVSLTTSFTASLACLSNIGPGLDAVGPAGNFAALSGVSKLTLTFAMLAGRLELFPMLILLRPDTWRKT